MTVESIMSRTPVTVSMDDGIWQVRDLMQVGRFHHVVVTDGERVVGIVSDRDVLHAISPAADGRFARSSDVATLHKRVHQVMTRRLVTVEPSTPIVLAGRLFLEHGVHCLPVVDEDGACVGIVTSTDVLRWSLDVAERGKAHGTGSRATRRSSARSA